ncbi:hypothetical protein J3F83DRAFT_656983 [Trichoderma novae-zelandiae]
MYMFASPGRKGERRNTTHLRFQSSSSSCPSLFPSYQHQTRSTNNKGSICPAMYFAAECWISQTTATEQHRLCSFFTLSSSFSPHSVSTCRVRSRLAAFLLVLPTSGLRFVSRLVLAVRRSMSMVSCIGRRRNHGHAESPYSLLHGLAFISRNATVQDRGNSSPQSRSKLYQAKPTCFDAAGCGASWVGEKGTRLMMRGFEGR